MFSCKHKKLSEVKEDGRQYCLNCNMAFVVECSHKWSLFNKDFQKCEKCGKIVGIIKAPCNHKWKSYDRRMITNTFSGNIIAIVDILRCEICGELKEFRIKN